MWSRPRPRTPITATLMRSFAPSAVIPDAIAMVDDWINVLRFIKFRFLVSCHRSRAAADLVEEFEKPRGVLVQIFHRAAAQQWRAHFISHAAGEPARAQRAKKFSVVDEA